MRRRIFAKISASVSLFKASIDPPFLLDQTEGITCPYNDFKDRAQGQKQLEGLPEAYKEGWSLRAHKIGMVKRER